MTEVANGRPNGNGYHATGDMIRIIIAVITVTFVATGGLFTAAFKMLDPYKESIAELKSEQHETNEKLQTVIVQQAVINQRLQHHMETTDAVARDAR